MKKCCMNKPYICNYKAINIIKVVLYNTCILRTDVLYDRLLKLIFYCVFSIEIPFYFNWCALILKFKLIYKCLNYKN